MRKSKLLLVLLLGLFAVFSSCEKKGLTEDDKSMQTDKLTAADMPELEVKDGMLSFNNEEDFLKTVSIIPNMTDEELDAWENKLGFISVRTKQNEFYQKLESYDPETLTDEAIENLVNEYSDYFEIVKDENGDDEIAEKIDDEIYSSISNQMLLYQTSEKVNKVIKNTIFTVDVSNVSDLNNPDNNNIKKIVYQDNSNKSSTDTKTAEYIKDERRCNRDRKVKITMHTRMYVYNPGYGGVYQYIWDVTVTVRGYRRYGCSGWANYKDPLDFKEVYGVIYVEYGTESFSIPAKSKYDRVLVGRKSYTRNSGQGYYDFVKAHGKGSSQGVGNEWAIISSGY